MPIFEYLCRCGRRFEKLVLGAAAEPPACPRCGSAEIERLYSRFAAVGSSKSAEDDFGADSGGEDLGGEEPGGEDDFAGGDDSSAQDDWDGSDDLD